MPKIIQIAVSTPKNGEEWVYALYENGDIWCINIAGIDAEWKRVHIPTDFPDVFNAATK